MWRNRHYDSGTGQCTQQDPIGLAGGANVYGFTNGDPVNYQDPFGLCPVCELATNAVALMKGPMFDALNPGGYVVTNEAVRINTVMVYQNLSEYHGKEGFEYQVSGGDRYEELSVKQVNPISGTELLETKIRSSSNGSVVDGSAKNSAHLDRNGGAAVDLRIRGVSNAAVDAAVKKTGFDSNKSIRNYPDKHTHLELPNKQ